MDPDGGMVQDVFLLPVPGGWMVHAPLRQVTALINRAGAARLIDQRFSAGSEEWRELCARLTFGSPSPPRPPAGALAPQYLGLVTTRACNLACRYCGFAATPGAPGMAPQLAVSAVDWMAERMEALGRERLEVHFFGGEPSVSWGVVEIAVHRARAIADARGLRPRFEIATNGVMDDRRVSFLGDHFHTVVLSFDGPREVHDLHRPAAGGRGSFDAVARTAHRISDSEADLCLRACVTAASVRSLPEIAEWFCEDFRPWAISFESLQPTPGSAAAGLSPPDPFEFAAFFLQAHRAAAERGVPAIYAAALAEEPRYSFCPVGNDSLIVLPDGRVCGCYLPDAEWRAQGLDLELGRFTPAGELFLDEAAVARLRGLVEDRPRCRGCFCRWSCAGGCHVHHSPPGCPREYDGFCLQTRLITAALLLAEMGRDDLAEELLTERACADRLARQASDRLEDLRQKQSEQAEEIP